jgi:hypothetical protein
MENYSIFGSDVSSVSPLADEEPIANSHELMLPHQKRLLLEELRFTSDDSGHSLETWAKKDIEGTLQLLADRAQYITGASGAAIALRAGEDIICRASSGPAAPEIGTFLQVNSGLSGESIRTRKVLRCDDAAADQRVNHASCRALGIASFAVMPLIREDQVIGIIEIFSGLPNSFEERDIIALQRIGEMVNTAIDHVNSARAQTAIPALAIDQTSVHQGVSPDDSIPPDLAGVEFHEAAGSPPYPLKLNEDERRALNEQGISTCAMCGFPVSEDRTVCVDCESSPTHNPPPAVPSPLLQTPAWLFAKGKDAGLNPASSATIASDDRPPSSFPESLLDPPPARELGFKTWIMTHKYLVGAVAIVGSAAIMLLLH